MAYTDEKIMELIRERGLLRYSTLMARLHISSVGAQNIVKDYISRGIVDENGRYGKKSECARKRFSPKTLAEINDEAQIKDDTVKNENNPSQKRKIEKDTAKTLPKQENISKDSTPSLQQDTNGQLFFF